MAIVKIKKIETYFGFRARFAGTIGIDSPLSSPLVSTRACFDGLDPLRVAAGAGRFRDIIEFFLV